MTFDCTHPQSSHIDLLATWSAARERQHSIVGLILVDVPKTVKATAVRDLVGVAATQIKVVRDLSWLFREQPIADYGIDAQFEAVEKGEATGKLIAAQIKSGPSYFANSTAGGWWFPLDADDLQYWLDHSLPVLVVLYDPDTDRAYWQSVTESTIVIGPKGGRKLLIPEAQTLDRDALPALSKIAAGRPYELRVRQLRLALPWMQLLQSGRRVLLEAEEWINKTSGRGDIQILSTDDASEDRVNLGSWFIMPGLRPYQEVLPDLVPWADVVLHQETYDDAQREAWESECVSWDREGDTWETLSYDDWASQFAGAELRPYRNGAGEVDFWRLELVLNDLGRGFLAVHEFAQADGWILTPRQAD